MRSKDHTTEASIEGVQASVEQRLSTNIVGEIGVRYYKQDATAASRNIQGATDVKDLTDDTIFNDSITNQSALNDPNKPQFGIRAQKKDKKRSPKLLK